MKILSLEIENILSIENAKIDFDDSGLVLVEGYNHDVGRANGAGKSAIFNALSFAIFDKVARKITASEILRRGCKTGRSICKIQLGQDIWEVARSRPKGVVFKKNDIIQDISQEEWERTLKFSYTQFLLSMYSAQTVDGGSPRFLSCNDSSKKSFLLDLFNLQNFSDCKKTIDDEIKIVLQSIEEHKNLSNNLESKMDAYSESLIDTHVIETARSVLQNSITNADKELIKYSNVNAPNLDKYYQLESNLNQEQTKISNARYSRQLLRASYDKLERQIFPYNPNIACDKCGSSLDSDEAEEIHNTHLAALKQEKLDIKLAMDEADVVIAKEKSIQELMKKLKDKKAQDSADYLEAKSRISDLNSWKNTWTSKIKDLDIQLLHNADLLVKIKDISTTIEKMKNFIMRQTKELEILKTIATIFSPTGAQAYVLDSVIDSFNEVIPNYISIVWPNASYSLNSYKENTKGDVVAKLSETLIMDAKEVSIGSLSGGELKALSLCVDFAMLDILNKNFGLTCNPIILDEPFDSLDVAGREIVLELLKTMAKDRQIIVVDHSTEIKAAFTKIIRVEKRNSISTVCVE